MRREVVTYSVKKDEQNSGTAGAEARPQKGGWGGGKMLKRLFRGWWTNICWGRVERRGVQGSLQSRPTGELVSQLCKWGLARSSPQGPQGLEGVQSRLGAGDRGARASPGGTLPRVK